MEGKDKIGRILTTNNVAGFVSPTSSTYGINKAFNGGMVQICRLDIVRVLSNKKFIQSIFATCFWSFFYMNSSLIVFIFMSNFDT